jgi:pimeloyl-ACP methyl ester carboxylesterase
MEPNVPHSSPQRVASNGLQLVYDTFGSRADPPMLLVMGLGGQMIAWDEAFCAQMAQRGFWLIRYDNRDVGLSTHLDDAGVPDIPALAQAIMQGQPADAPYSLRDMAEDAVGLLDALEIDAAHVVGVSMGGMIAQEMAIHHPERLRTLTSIMSSTGDPELPMPRPEAVGILLTPAPMDREGYLDSAVAAARVLNGSGFPVDEAHEKERAAKAYERGLSPAGTARQLAAVMAAESRREALQSVQVPTLVIHGDDDPLVPVEGGMDTAAAIPGAELLLIEGMGHALPPAVWPQVMDAVVEKTQRGRGINP